MTQIMPPAPYNRDSVARLRALAGLGVEAAAGALNWDAERVRRVAARHSIVVGEAPRPAPAAPPPPPAPKKPARPAKRGRFRAFVAGHPRDRKIHIGISAAALRRLAQNAASIGKTPNGCAGAALDYLLRNGQFDAVLQSALAELGGRP